MTFDEWIATQDKCHPADWSSLPSAYRFWINIARAAWDEGHKQACIEYGEEFDEDCPELAGHGSNYDL